MRRLNKSILKFLETKNGGKSESTRRMVDITRDKPIKVSIRVAVPVRDHPKVGILYALGIHHLQLNEGNTQLYYT